MFLNFNSAWCLHLLVTAHEIVEHNKCSDMVTSRATWRASFCDACFSWTSSAVELFLEQNTSATICLWSVCHVAALVVFHYFVCGYYFVQFKYNGWMFKYNGWMDGSMDGSMDRWMDRSIGGWMDGWMDGWIDRSIDRSIERR